MKAPLRKSLALLLSLVLLAGCIAGCSDSSSSSTPQSSSSSGQSSSQTDGGSQPQTNDKPYEGVVLKYATTDTAATGPENLALVELVKEQTGIVIEFTIIPSTSPGEVDKTLVMLQAGDELDIMYGSTPVLKPYYSAGVLEPVDALAAAAGYDMKSVFGDNLPVMLDGQAYGLPAFSDIWLTMYNKKIFDDAGVAYPDPNNWTWETYIETAKKINEAGLKTEAGEQVWGSYMLDYDCYNYMYALQKGAQAYKADGTANFDDPLFAESLEFFYGLGNTEKIQPDIVSYTAELYPWNAFMAMGNMGMWVIGGWGTSMLPNTERYPRDWTAGIVPMPYPQGESASTLVVNGNYAIPVTSKNKEAAFEAIRCMAENQYTLGYGRVPARIDLDNAEIDRYITENLLPTFELDGFTVEDIKTCWFDPARQVLPEKIVGPGDASISQIFKEEGLLYGQGSKSLEDAIKSIQERSNAAIADEKAA